MAGGAVALRQNLAATIHVGSCVRFRHATQTVFVKGFGLPPGREMRPLDGLQGLGARRDCINSRLSGVLLSRRQNACAPDGKTIRGTVVSGFRWVGYSPENQHVP